MIDISKSMKTLSVEIGANIKIVYVELKLCCLINTWLTLHFPPAINIQLHFQQLYQLSPVSSPCRTSAMSSLHTDRGSTVKIHKWHHTNFIISNTRLKDLLSWLWDLRNWGWEWTWRGKEAQPWYGKKVVLQLKTQRKKRRWHLILLDRLSIIFLPCLCSSRCCRFHSCCLLLFRCCYSLQARSWSGLGERHLPSCCSFCWFCLCSRNLRRQKLLKKTSFQIHAKVRICLLSFPVFLR